MRRLFLSALALGATMAGAGFVQEAQAQRVVSLNPQTDWAVKKIGGKGQNFDSYCAVAREFPRRTILTIAKNNKAETSIAFDFQKHEFDVKRYFSMSLDVGYDEKRSFEVRPVSEQGFVVRLGRDDPFFSALAKSREMRVNLEDKVYNFNLQDIEKGQYELDTCLAALTMPAAGEDLSLSTDRPQIVDSGKTSVKPPPSSALSQTAATMRESQLRQELENMREENGRLRGYLSKQRLDIAQNVKTDGDSSAIIGLSGENALLELENDRLRVQLAQAESRNEYGDDSVRRELMRLRTENALLQADLDAKQSGDNWEARMQEKIASVKQERDQMKATLDKVSKNYENLSRDSLFKKDEYTKLQEENEWLRVDLQRSKQQLTEAEADLGREKDEAQHLRTRMATLQEQNTTLQQTKLSRLTDDTDSNNTILLLKDENARLRKDLGDFDAARNVSENALESLRRDNEELQAKLASLQTASGEGAPAPAQEPAPEMLQQNADLTEKIKVLESDKAGLQESQSALSETLAKTQEDLRRQESALESLKSDLSKEQEKNASLVASLTKRGALPKPSVAGLAPLSAAAAEVPASQTQAARLESVESGEPVAIPIDRTVALLRAGEVKTHSVAAAVSPVEEHAQLSQQARQAIQSEILFDPQTSPPVREAPGKDSPVYDNDSGLSESQKQDLALSRQHIQKESQPMEMPEFVEEAALERPKAALVPVPPKKEEVLQGLVETSPPKTVEKPDAAQNYGRLEALASHNTQGLVEIFSLEDEAAPLLRNPGLNAADKSLPEIPFAPSYSIESLIQQAQISYTQPPVKIGAASKNGHIVHQWRAGDVFGSSDQRPLRSINDFDQEVQNYLKNSKQRCQGSFSVIPVSRTNVNGERLSSYEVGCIGPGINASASLLFFSRGATFSVIAHETTPASMASAIEARDRIVRALRKVSS